MTPCNVNKGFVVLIIMMASYVVVMSLSNLQVDRAPCGMKASAAAEGCQTAIFFAHWRHKHNIPKPLIPNLALLDRIGEDFRNAAMDPLSNDTLRFDFLAIQEIKRKFKSDTSWQPWWSRHPTSASHLPLEHGRRRLRSLGFASLLYLADDLVELCVDIFTQAGVGVELGLSRGRLQALAESVRGEMLDNPHHDWCHAADTLQACYLLAARSGLLGRMSPARRLGLLAAALCHDLQHPGVNGRWLAASGSALAALYGGGPGCLELHHSFRAFRLLSGGLLDALTPEDREEALATVQALIPATDMTLHPNFVAALPAFAPVSFDGPAGSSEAAAVERKAAAAEKEAEAEVVMKAWEAGGEEGRVLLMQALIKTADLANVIRPFPVARLAAARVTDELILQSQLEAALAVARTSGAQEESAKDSCCADMRRVTLQLGFLDMVVAPWFRAVAAVLPTLRKPLLDRMGRAREKWAQCANDEELRAAVAAGEGCDGKDEEWDDSHANMDLGGIHEAGRRPQCETAG